MKPSVKVVRYDQSMLDHYLAEWFILNIALFDSINDNIVVEDEGITININPLFSWVGVNGVRVSFDDLSITQRKNMFLKMEQTLDSIVGMDEYDAFVFLANTHFSTITEEV